MKKRIEPPVDLPSYPPSLLPERSPKTTTAPSLAGQTLSTQGCPTSHHTAQRPPAPHSSKWESTASTAPRFHRFCFPVTKRSQGKAMHQPLFCTGFAPLRDQPPAHSPTHAVPRGAPMGGSAEADTTSPALTASQGREGADPAREGADPRGRQEEGCRRAAPPRPQGGCCQPIHAPGLLLPHAGVGGSPQAGVGVGRGLPGGRGGCWPRNSAPGCRGRAGPAVLPVRAGHSPSVPSGTLPRATAGPSRKIVSSPPDTMLPLFSVCRSRVSCLFSTVAHGTWRKRPPVTTGIAALAGVAPLPQPPCQPPGLLQPPPSPKDNVPTPSGPPVPVSTTSMGPTPTEHCQRIPASPTTRS